MPRQALIASKANAERNGVADKLKLYLPEQQPEIEADLVMANILAGPLGDLRSVITHYCKPEGHLVMSGILDVQAERIAALYSEDFDMEPTALETEWARVSGKKHPLFWVECSDNNGDPVRYNFTEAELKSQS